MQKNLYNNFVNDFSKIMCSLADGKQYSNIIFLCIGSDRMTGDSFGPLVGTKLKVLFQKTIKIDIIGNLETPVNSSNICSVSNDIIKNYENPFIIAIDAALSVNDNVGSILVNAGGIDLRK